MKRMKRLYVFSVLGLAILLGLAACSQDADDGTRRDVANSVSQNEGSEAGSGETSSEKQVETIIAEINDDFSNALTPMGQLALGTLKLEDGELAVNEDQAADLLPLWQALQSLSNSQTTAQVELDAVVKQIQGTMSAEQVVAIAEMQLTGDSLTGMMESGELAIRGFGGRNAEGEGGFPLSPSGSPGGGPGGLGRPGGGPGGFGGGFGVGLSEDDIATRRAKFAESGLGDIQERFLTGAVVRLMQTKTGASPADRSGLLETVFELIGEETGLSTEEIQAALAEGQTLADIIEANGGDVEAVREALVEAFGELPNADQFDPEQLADQWLGEQ